MKKDWMTELAAQYEKTRRQYSEDPLIILFDIDGTILDTRFMVLHVLQAFDKEHGTRFFQRLQVSDINVHENQVDILLTELQVPHEKQEGVLDWYNQQRWSSVYILHAHKPFVGVLEVVRWYQLQPNTFAGLNTGCPETLRQDTLRSLNELGKEYKVQFSDALLHMNPAGWEQDVGNAKVSGVRNFQSEG